MQVTEYRESQNCASPRIELSTTCFWKQSELTVIVEHQLGSKQRWKAYSHQMLGRTRGWNSKSFDRPDLHLVKCRSYILQGCQEPFLSQWQENLEHGRVLFQKRCFSSVVIFKMHGVCIYKDYRWICIGGDTLSFFMKYHKEACSYALSELLSKTRGNPVTCFNVLVLS